MARGSGDLRAKGGNDLGLDCKEPLVSPRTSFFYVMESNWRFEYRKTMCSVFGKVAGGRMETGQGKRAVWQRLDSIDLPRS